MLRVVGRAIKRVDRRAEIVTAGLPPSKLRSAVPLDRYERSFAYIRRRCARLRLRGVVYYSSRDSRP
jgi:hypothetical protein